MINGKIDSVFDRCGFVAIEGVEQEMYIRTIRKLLADNFRYLLLVVVYDQSKRNIPPFSQPEEKVRKFYNWGTVEKLYPLDNKSRNPLVWEEVLYLITPRKN